MNLKKAEAVAHQPHFVKEEVGTFRYDEKLPNLPVPRLNHTMNRYLNSVKPFAESEEEYKETEKIVIEFLKGEGLVLHEKLLQHAVQHKNWIEKWWEDYAYLTLREPLIPFYSMSGSHPRLSGYQYGPGQQIKMASLYCHQLVRIWHSLREERYQPALSADNHPLSMSQFRRLFNCSVLPGEVKDLIKANFKTEKEGWCSSEVVVLCKGHMFLINSLTPEGYALSPADWEHQLTEVQHLANNLQPTDFPCLSSDYRSPWARNREHLVNLDPDNAKSFAALDSAMFVVCLDDASPISESEIAHLILCGDYSCRWPDAALNIVFFSNGLSGGLCAHSPFDGIVSGSAMYHALSALREQTSRGLSAYTHQRLPHPQELKFNFDEYIISEITRVKNFQHREKNNILMLQKEFSLFGKKRIQNSKVHPDTFIQMALQLSYFRLHSRFAPCYETATTRRFYNGRTETVRSCTQECVSWVKSMTDPLVNSSMRAKLLLKAIQKHNNLMAEARSGLGCDRHLMGLYCIAMESNLPVPRLFQDPLYKKSGGGGNFILSTSLLGYSPMGGGVAPMCSDGYGVFYNIMADRLMFTISVYRVSFKTSALRLFNEICRSLQDMVFLLESQPHSNL